MTTTPLTAQEAEAIRAHFSALDCETTMKPRGEGFVVKVRFGGHAISEIRSLDAVAHAEQELVRERTAATRNHLIEQLRVLGNQCGPLSQELFDQAAEATVSASHKTVRLFESDSSDGRLRGGDYESHSEWSKVAPVFHIALWRCDISALSPESLKAYVWPADAQYPDRDRFNPIYTNETATRGQLLPYVVGESGALLFVLPSDDRMALCKRLGVLQ